MIEWDVLVLCSGDLFSSDKRRMFENFENGWRWKNVPGWKVNEDGSGVGGGSKLRRDKLLAKTYKVMKIGKFVI